MPQRMTQENIRKGQVLEQAVGKCLKRLKVRWFKLNVPSGCKRGNGDIDALFMYNGKLHSVECKNWFSEKVKINTKNLFQRHIGSRFTRRFSQAVRLVILAGIAKNDRLMAMLVESGIASLFLPEALIRKTDSTDEICSFLAPYVMSTFSLFFEEDASSEDSVTFSDFCEEIENG